MNVTLATIAAGRVLADRGLATVWPVYATDGADDGTLELREGAYFDEVWRAVWQPHCCQTIRSPGSSTAGKMQVHF